MVGWSVPYHALYTLNYEVLCIVVLGMSIGRWIAGIEKARLTRHGVAMSRHHGYLLVMGTADERTGMDRYQSKLPPIYAAHNGYRLVMGGRP